MFVLIPGSGKAIPQSVLQDPRSSIDARFLMFREFQLGESIVEADGSVSLSMNVMAFPVVELSYYTTPTAKKPEVVNIPVTDGPIGIVMCSRTLDAIPGLGKKTRGNIENRIASILSFTARLNELEAPAGETVPSNPSQVDDDADVEEDDDTGSDDDGVDEAGDDTIVAMSTAVSRTDAANNIRVELTNRTESLRRYFASIAEKPQRRFFLNEGETLEEGEQPTITPLSVAEAMELLANHLDTESGELSEAETFLRAASDDCVMQAILKLSGRRPNAKQPAHQDHPVN